LELKGRERSSSPLKTQDLNIKTFNKKENKRNKIAKVSRKQSDTTKYLLVLIINCKISLHESNIVCLLYLTLSRNTMQTYVIR
jgi:hypothetical protein